MRRSTRYRERARVRVAKASLRSLYAARQLKTSDPESGGLLLGRLVHDSQNVVIDEVTFPVRRDKQSRFRFLRSRQPAQERVDAAWRESSQTRIYLGEWYSHPEDDPSPSGHDLKNWRQIVTDAAFDAEQLLFVIVGRRRIRMWTVTLSGALEELGLTRRQRRRQEQE